MKRLEDFLGQNLTGGAPFFSEDFFTVQEEIYAAIFGMAENLSQNINGVPSTVVAGCVISPNGGNFDVSPGIVFINTGSVSQLYRFPGATNITSGNKYIRPDSDVLTTRVYNDGGTKNFFRERRAVIGANTTGAIEFDPSSNNLPRIGTAPPSGEVTLADIEDIATSRILGRVSGGSGVIEQLTPAQVATLLTNLIGADQLESNAVQTAKIGNDQVTYPKIQNVSGDRILGRLSSTGELQELTGAQVASLLPSTANPSVSIAWNMDLLSTIFVGYPAGVTAATVKGYSGLVTGSGASFPIGYADPSNNYQTELTASTSLVGINVSRRSGGFFDSNGFNAVTLKVVFFV